MAYEQKQPQLGDSKLICQRWQWKERGWDSEPDGFSLHLSLDALKLFVREYWEGMPDRDAYGRAPNQYACPEDYPYWAAVDYDTWFAVSLTGSLRYDTRFTYPDIELV